MKFKIDHDLHIHSFLSSCSSDPQETPEAILAYAVKNGFRTVCLTDHFWDETVPGASQWYEPQNFPHLSEALPLPQAPGCRFLFGCEAEMDKNRTLGISAARYAAFDFVVVPTTHLHMHGFTIEPSDVPSPARRAELCRARFAALLDAPVPFEKTGLAHITCSLLGRGVEGATYVDVIDPIDDDDWGALFARAAKAGLGIELNFKPADIAPDELPRVLRPYRIARACGCRFYLGSDAHHPGALDGARARFETIVDLLGLEEKDKIEMLR